MTYRIEHFWIEFMISSLPEEVRKKYENLYSQTRFNYQSFIRGKTFWVRQEVHEQHQGDFILPIYNNHWENLPYAIHQEVSDKEVDRLDLKVNKNYFQIDAYRVYRHTMRIGYTFYLGDEVWCIDETEPYTYQIYPWL